MGGNWKAGATTLEDQDFIPTTPLRTPRGVTAGPDVDLATVLNDKDDTSYLRVGHTFYYPGNDRSRGQHQMWTRSKVVPVGGPLTELKFALRCHLAQVGPMAVPPDVYLHFERGDGGLIVETLGTGLIPEPTPVDYFDPYSDPMMVTYTGTVTPEQLDAAGVSLDDINAAIVDGDYYVEVRTFANGVNGPGPFDTSGLPLVQAAPGFLLAVNGPTSPTIHGTGDLGDAGDVTTRPDLFPDTGADLPLNAAATGPCTHIRPINQPFGPTQSAPTKINGAFVNVGGWGVGTVRVTIRPGQSSSFKIFDGYFTFSTGEGEFSWSQSGPITVDPAVTQPGYADGGPLLGNQFFDAFANIPGDSSYQSFAPWATIECTAGSVKIRSMMIQLYGESNLVLDVADLASTFDDMVVEDPTSEPILLNANLNGNLKDVDRSFT